MAPLSALAPDAWDASAMSIDLASIRPAREADRVLRPARGPWGVAFSFAAHLAVFAALLTWATPVAETPAPEPITVEIVVEQPAAEVPTPPGVQPSAPPAVEPPVAVEPPPPPAVAPPPVVAPPPPPVAVEPPPAPLVVEPPPAPLVVEPPAPPVVAPPPPVVEPAPPPTAVRPPPPPVLEAPPAPQPLVVARPPPPKPAPPPARAAPAPAKPPQPAARPRVEAAPSRAAPAAVPATPKPAPAPAASHTDLSAYGDAVRSRIAGRVHYPEAARERGPHGVAVVAFSLDGSGQVLGASISQSAGDAVLDADAVATVRRAGPFPPPPAGAPRNYSAPLRYRAP